MKRTVSFGLSSMLMGLMMAISPTTTIEAKNIAGLRFSSIQMFSSTKGWGEIGSNNTMKILHTANGGSNWQVVDSSSGAIGDVFFGSGDMVQI